MALPTQEEVDRLIIAYESAKYETARATGIIIETEQRNGMDYTTVWSNEINRGE